MTISAFSGGERTHLGSTKQVYCNLGGGGGGARKFVTTDKVGGGTVL